MGALRGQRYGITLDLRLEVILPHLACMLGTKLCPPTRALCVLITEPSLACVVAVESHTILHVQVSYLSFPRAGSIVTTPDFQYFFTWLDLSFCVATDHGQ